MSDSDIDQVISIAQYSGHEIHIKDKNGKVNTNICEKRENPDLTYHI